MTTHKGSSHSAAAEAIVQEADPLIDRFDLVYLLRRYLRVFVVVPVLCAVIGGVMVKLRPTLFQSSVLIYIDPKFDQIMRFETFEGGSASDLDSLSSLEIMIVADSMVLRVVDRLGLRKEAGFLPANLAENRDLSEQQLVRFLQEERFAAELVEGTRLIKISVKDPNAARAQRIVGAFAEEFDEFLVERRQEEAKRARVTLEAQVGNARSAARESEDLLRGFREDHPEFLVEQDHDMFAARLTKFSGDLSAVESQRMELESQVEYLTKVDPETAPLTVFEVAGYDVSDLLRLRDAAAARLAAADKVGSERGYQAIASEFRRHEEQLWETAAEVKRAVRSKFEVTKQREETLHAQLKSVQADLVMVKSLSSEFRVLHQQAERRWLVVENLQNRLSESVVAMDSHSNIATEVSQPLTPYKKIGSNTLLMLFVGGCVGGLISLVWVGARFLIGLPYTHRSQLEGRFGTAVIADWSSDPPATISGSGAFLLHSLGAGGAKVVQFFAPGSPGLGKSVAKRVAKMTSDAGEKTLLVILNSKLAVSDSGYQPRSIGTGQLVRLDAPAQAAIQGGVLEHYLQQHGDDFAHIFVEGGDAGDAGIVSWLATLSDKNVVVVAAGAVEKRKIDRAIEAFSADGMSPTGVMLVGADARRKVGAGRRLAETPDLVFEGEKANAG